MSVGVAQLGQNNSPLGQAIGARGSSVNVKDQGMVGKTDNSAKLQQIIDNSDENTFTFPKATTYLRMLS